MSNSYREDLFSTYLVCLSGYIIGSNCNIPFIAVPTRASRRSDLQGCPPLPMLFSNSEVRPMPFDLQSAMGRLQSREHNAFV